MHESCEMRVFLLLQYIHAGIGIAPVALCSSNIGPHALTSSSQGLESAYVDVSTFMEDFCQ
jgi:hypothetical protein